MTLALLLAIDTATRCASLALHDGARVRVELSWESPDHHTVELTPRVAGMLSQIEVTMDNLAGIAISLGPGSFTGLRVGVSLAKGLAMARNLKLVGVPTLDIVAQAMQDAHASQEAHTPLVAVLAAGRGRLVAQKYQWTRHALTADGKAWLTTARELGADWQETMRVCGELNAEERHELKKRLGVRVGLASPAACLRRAGYLAELGWARLRAGQVDDPATLAPIYIQTPSGSPA